VVCLSAGVHFIRVSQLLGHATYTVTLDTYGDWIEQDDTAAATRQLGSLRATE
jgi:integrase